MRKYPSDSRNLISHANGLIKYMPIDKEASDMLSPLLNMGKGGGLMGGMMGGMRSGSGMNGGNGNGMRNGNSMMMSHQEKRMVNSGRVDINNGTKNVKRSVSETKKKYVAAQQGWNCGACKKQLPAWFEVDHKVRLDSGGSNNVDNLVALCRDCHGKKTAFENL